MADLSRVVVVWTGSPVVGGGVSVLHCDPGSEHGLMVAFRAFLNTMAAGFPTGLQWSFPGAGNVINDANGDVVATWADSSPPSPLSPAGGTSWVNGVGVRVKWITAGIHAGHHVSGSTFLVPITSANFEGAGNILDTTIATFQGAANTLVSTGLLKVWSRDKPLVPGASFQVVGAVVPDKVSWLRGRRT